MVAASTLGAALGVSVQLYANAVSSREEESARASLAAVLFFSVRVGGSVALAGPCALETAFAERNIPALPWWIGWPFEMRPSASNHTLFHSSPPDAFFFFCLPSQVRKLPTLHQPWLHLAWGAAGAVGANALVTWTDATAAEVEVDLVKRRAAGRRA